MGQFVFGAFAGIVMCSVVLMVRCVLWYKVFDTDGKVVYEPKAAEPAVKVPFLVKVSIPDLNIRKGPGTDYDRVQFIPIGVYTIMEVRSGKDSSAGWGRLKSGIGWISLDFVRRL